MTSKPVPTRLTFPHEQPIPAARLLEWALLFTFVAHGLGMLSLLIFLLPGLPGGSTPSDADRISYIAAHPWLWRLGWLPWQITAVSDILLAIALVRTPWIPRLPAFVTLTLTCFAILPDQIGQALWITEGVRLAERATLSHNLGGYLQYEAVISRATSAWAATVYTLAAIGWTWCFVSAGTWNTRLTLLSIPLWLIFLFAGVGPLVPEALRPSAPAIGIANALGFLLMEWWFLEVLEQVLRRSRLDDGLGRYMAWRAPQSGAIGGLANVWCNSRVVRLLCEFVPGVPFDSDITDVVYNNYIVEANRVEPLVPSGLLLRRLGPEGKYALFTLLTYKHGRLGPRPARKWPVPLPSAIQSNWRIHIRDPRTGYAGIYFVTNAATHPIVCIGGRLMLEAMPMHLLAGGILERNADGCFRIVLDPGTGSGPDVQALLCPTEDRTLPEPWASCFESYDAFLEYCVPQNRAMASQPWYGRISRQEIRLDIPLTDCKPLSGPVHSRLVQEIAGDCAPLSFHVVSVAFRFDRQEFDEMPISTLPVKQK